MTTLTPLAFPEDQHPAKPHSSAFPYGGVYEHNNTPINPGTQRMQQLEDMLKEAQGRAEIIEKEAYEKAYLAGEKAGMALGRKRGEQILGAIQQTMQEAEISLTSVQQSFAEAAMDVACHIARQIVGDALSESPTIMLDIANQAAAQLPDTSSLCIAVSLDDFSSFKRLLEAEDGMADSMAMLRSDASVANGSCRVISKQQDILIDPVAAVAACLDKLDPALMQAGPQTASQPEQQEIDSEENDAQPS